MARTATCKVKVFNIYVNDRFVCNSFGENQTQAIAFFCKERGLQSGRCTKIGDCKMEMNRCIKGPNGLYNCGRRTKCNGISVAPCSIGQIIAVPVQ